MLATFTTCFNWLALRLPAVLWRGSSVRTADFEIRAPTTEGVRVLMQELRNMPPTQPLPSPAKNDSLPGTVQAEEPMTVKG